MTAAVHLTHTHIWHSLTLTGVDILPSELPKDSSEYFGTALSPLLPPILRSMGSASPEDLHDLPAELRRYSSTIPDAAY